jgi:heterogeneous nuclear rnp K-like protein 2
MTVTKSMESDTTSKIDLTSVCLFCMGSIVGKNNEKIKEIQADLGAHLVASEMSLLGLTKCTITITGTPDAIHIAVYHIVALQTQECNPGSRDT